MKSFHFSTVPVRTPQANAWPQKTTDRGGGLSLSAVVPCRGTLRRFIEIRRNRYLGTDFIEDENGNILAMTMNPETLNGHRIWHIRDDRVRIQMIPDDNTPVVWDSELQCWSAGGGIRAGSCDSRTNTHGSVVNNPQTLN